MSVASQRLLVYIYLQHASSFCSGSGTETELTVPVGAGCEVEVRVQGRVSMPYQVSLILTGFIPPYSPT